MMSQRDKGESSCSLDPLHGRHSGGILSTGERYPVTIDVKSHGNTGDLDPLFQELGRIIFFALKGNRDGRED